jgi:hypothetical protein
MTGQQPSTLTTHDGQPARYRVVYADYHEIPGDDRDSLFATRLAAEQFIDGYADDPEYAETVANLRIIPLP